MSPTNKTEHTSTPNIASSLDRQWKVLSHLSARRWVGTQHIKQQLELEGITVSLRTIQRDLNQLAERFPIEGDNSTPQGWRWQQGVDYASFPLMNSSQALTFIMVESYLKDLLPPTLIQQMQPWFNQAKRSIGEDNKLTQWMNHIQVLPATQPLIPPALDSAAQAEVYEALLDKKQIQIYYQKRKSKVKAYQLHPLAIVHKGGVIYLIAIKTDDSKLTPRQFAMHRICEAKLLALDSLSVDFNLSEYIDQGHMGYHSQALATNDDTIGSKKTITLVFSAASGASLLESKLSKNQKNLILENGDIQVTASVPLTQQLGWWLRGFGKGLKSISPQVLSDFVREG